MGARDIFISSHSYPNYVSFVGNLNIESNATIFFSLRKSILWDDKMALLNIFEWTKSHVLLINVKNIDWKFYLIEIYFSKAIINLHKQFSSTAHLYPFNYHRIDGSVASNCWFTLKFLTGVSILCSIRLRLNISGNHVCVSIGT